ncbi:hypothetical protein FHT80_005769 [Rhizobium sp. BK226]|jgi:hypothetical protein|uniref:hypothetical protein n=1 Tax=Rhizobium sp. BK226 TaxID=2587075 RepID=UPI00160852B6|nr:hypothetical protein [Rhizobium sp. BK226]MBB4116395.1 hypothetical protein [Rhizobium sp. BK226]
MANEDHIELEYNRKLGLARGVIRGRFAIGLTMTLLSISVLALVVYWSSHA